jgi:hypothetical protein
MCFLNIGSDPASQHLLCQASKVLEFLEFLSKVETEIGIAQMILPYSPAWSFPRTLGVAAFALICLIQVLRGPGEEDRRLDGKVNVDLELKAKEVDLKVDQRRLDID